jgi:signal transduction histidine kinase/CheY-like chemotaxis protein
LARLRREASQSLQAQETELREAQRLAHLGSWRWDAATDTVNGSDELFHIFGLDPVREAFPNFKDQDGYLYPHESWQCIDAAVRQTLQTGVGYELEVNAFRKGEPIWIRTRSEVVHDVHGNIVGLRGTVQDITEHKRAERALKDADRQKDEFLATLAHELRNPLAPLRNGLQIMKLAESDATTVRKARSMMERQLGQMAHLIDDLMDLSRISMGRIALQKKRLRLSDAIHDAVDLSRPLLDEEGHTFLLDVPRESIYVEGDRTRLAQVFANLLNNAAKYTDRGGRIRLLVERQGGDAIATVEDNGVGIAAPMLSKVFDMFTQVDRSLEQSRGGLGIGLNIVKRLVEMHDGRITAESDGPGTGSRFVVRLPTVTAVDTDKPEEIGHDSASAVSQRRILVADDNRDTASSLAVLLEMMGNETVTAHDGREALEVGAWFKPDVVLLDIGMPELNGLDVCRRIREEAWGRDIVIVACTGWGQDDDRRKSSEAGFDHHLVKPVDYAVLMKLLASV